MKDVLGQEIKAGYYIAFAQATGGPIIFAKVERLTPKMVKPVYYGVVPPERVLVLTTSLLSSVIPQVEQRIHDIKQDDEL